MAASGSASTVPHAYNFAIPFFEEGLVLLLVITGVLIGAPFVAHEIERRTQLVARTQSTSCRRYWISPDAAGYVASSGPFRTWERPAAGDSRRGRGHV